MSSSTIFNELPRKALHQIFSSVCQAERQKFRPVCHFWKNFIDDDFPIQVVINQGNFECLFQCSNVSVAEIQSLTTEYTGSVAFGPRLRSIQFTGKVLSSNIFSILRHCPNLETLCFSSLKQVLGIEGVESVKLPKVTTVEIKVRPDQETFSSDEIIVISALRQIIFGSLETILISTRSPYDLWDEDEDDADYNMSGISEDPETTGFTLSAPTPQSTPSDAVDNILPQILQVDEVTQPISDSVVEVVVGESQQQDPGVSISNGGGGASTAATQTPTTNPTNLHVIINRAANFPEVSGSDGVTSRASSSSSNRRMRHNVSDFEARLFHANLELLVMEGSGSNTLNVFNDSVSQTRMDSTMYFDIPGIVAPAIKHTVFFELVKNNLSTLKNLYVRTRADFMCFGNLTGFSRDVTKVHFEEVDYSFGRMQMCYEYILLRAQCKLKKLKMQILDDLWPHLLLAVANSQQTLTDLDIKVMSVNEGRMDITPITACANLKSLKLLHFFEKESLCRLPKTLNTLVLNGPVSYQDMNTWTNDLVELVELTLLLNTRGDKIDLTLYKKFLKMPKLRKLNFIQCPMDLEAIKGYVDHGILSKTGLRFSINGPFEVREIPAIQYVYTSISPDQFDREQIEI